ncbi:RNA polymerase sigma factor [Corynebacterium variabile]|uniref:RNA polymerase sigma factor n=1 Tax=Corynebacterium variabile TaxID=1727 RepID=UPI003BB11FC6
MVRKQSLTSHRIAARLITDRGLAEDLAQSALKRLWGLEEVPRNVPAWLTTTIRNLAIDRHRRDVLGPVPDDGLADMPASRTVSRGVVERAYIQDVLDALPHQHRDALLLSAAGFTNTEIAEELGLASAASVAAILSRLRRRLREQRDQTTTTHHPSPGQRPRAAASKNDPHRNEAGVSMNQVPVEVAERIREIPVDDHFVIPGATPVPFFGNQPGARVATVGINPSSRELLTDQGVELDGPRRRFETRQSLGLSDPAAELSDDQVAAVYQRCLHYFNDTTVAYWSWFKQLESIIGPLADGASYLDGTACHLDLVQWPTKPVWTGITDVQVREALAERDLEFLLGQLSSPQLEIVYLNGSQVYKVLSTLIPLEERKATFREGITRTFYRGRYGHTAIVGCSVFIQNAHIRTEEKHGFIAWIIAECRKDLRELGGEADA